MIETIDDHFVRRVRGWTTEGYAAQPAGAPAGWARGAVTDADLLTLFTAQLLARHLDFAARELQVDGEGFYTIGSSGHESNAAVAMALRPTDPALLHYRSGGFYCARAAQVAGIDPATDVLRSLTCSVDDPISGGRHKVFGHPSLAIIPQTSTIASHLPRAVGLAFSLDRRKGLAVPSEWPEDAVVVASLGDASVNHSTAAGAFNAAGQITHRGVPLPLLLVVEDNGIGISVRTPEGWTGRTLERQPGFRYLSVDGSDPESALAAARDAVTRVRAMRSPAILHLRTVRFMGHAGSDVELAYRSRVEIQADYSADPLLALAAVLVSRGIMHAEDILERYEQTRGDVAERAKALRPVSRLTSAAEVMSPLTEARPVETRAAALAVAPDREDAFRGQLPEDAGPLTLAQSLNAALTDLLAARPESIVFGEDVAAKGGVYGVTRALRKRFGGRRVFDTLLDEQTILGTALGAALAGFLPVPEIQYLAYLHNAEDQLRGEAATLRFFSAGRYSNGMVVRVPGLAYQRGFGGHYHNDNSVAVLRDIPGLVVGVPSSPAEAPGMLRAMAGMAVAEGRVCVLLEPIALYHTKDLLPGDGAWTAPYAAPEHWGNHTAELRQGTLHGNGKDVLVVTFGNGVPMSLRAVQRATERATALGRLPLSATVYDLRWLAPLPTAELAELASRFDRVLVVDETRASGAVSEGVVTALIDAAYRGSLSRVTSRDSIIPLGPASGTVLLSEDQIVDALLAL